MWSVGIDEAGRGPVLGSMVYVAVAWRDADAVTGRLPAGVRLQDSKAARDVHRHAAWTAVASAEPARGAIDGSHMTWEMHRGDGYQFCVVDVPAVEMNSRMESESLNVIASEAAAFALTRATDGLAPCAVVADRLGVSAEAHEAALRARVPRWEDRVASFASKPKADATDAVVSLASMLAKERREAGLARALAALDPPDWTTHTSSLDDLRARAPDDKPRRKRAAPTDEQKAARRARREEKAAAAADEAPRAADDKPRRARAPRARPERAASLLRPAIHGYPSEPRTLIFLRLYQDHPVGRDLIRRHWATVKNL